ncbi:MAG: glycosyltransferase [Paracoccaceae bacterium]
MDILSRQFDLLYIADFRKGDSDAASAIQALRALAEGGYRIAVLPWMGPVVADPFRLDAGLNDLFSTKVRLVSCDARLSCRLILAQDLRLFANRAAQTLTVECDNRIVICSRGGPPTPRALRSTVARAKEALGGPVTLAPAAAPIRASLQSLMPDGRYTPVDWLPTVAAKSPLPAPLQDRVSLPLLGYFRAAQSRLWPDSPEALREVLPDHPLLGLSVLGAPEACCETLRAGAAPVFFEDPEVCDPGDFLRNVDALATNADPLDDPWPTEVLHALANGTIPLLSPDFRSMFVAAALYAHPGHIADTVTQLFTSPDLSADLRAAGQELIDEILAPRHIVARVSNLIGPPAATAPISCAVIRPAGTVMSISTNGIGMGHLARQMAIARRLEPHLTPVFLGFSQSIATVRQFGWISEYLPYHSGPAIHTAHWNDWLAKALDAACKFYRPRALVLDANIPFEAFVGLRERQPGLPMIWVRRAMWGPGRDIDALERAHLFDTVIEPGEAAAAYDTGPTADVLTDVRRVAPMHLVDAADLPSRQEAAAELGIAADTLNVLLMPGALNNFDAANLWSGVVEELGRWPDTSVVAAEWAIAERPVDWPPFVLPRKGFPYARWFNAFDFAVSAAGYNSFAELTGLGLPTIFVPNENPLMDRQDLRARFAHRNGLGLHLAADASSGIRPALAQMRDAGFRAAIRTRLAAVARMHKVNGAVEAAGIVSAWADAGRSNRADGWQ